MEVNKEILCKILNINEINSNMLIINWKIVKNIVKVGTNNSSELSRLIVEYRRKSKLFKKSFIMKIPCTHPLYDSVSKYEIYDKEFLFYTTVLEEMYKLDGEHIGPRFYYTDGKHSMILKDLDSSGYKMKDRLEQLDYAHCRLVFIYLAKFHALSVQLDQSDKINPELKRSKVFDVLKDDQNSLNALLSAYDWFVDVLNYSTYKEKLKRCRNMYLKRFKEEKEPRENKFTVLNHGDCWTGNILFKSDKYGNVQKVKFLDFQYCGWCSPAHDILYFIITSMKFEIVGKNFDLLLETYIDVLNKILKFFQCKTYELEDLKNDMKSPFSAIWILSLTLAEYLSSQDNPWDTRDSVKDGIFDLDYWKMHYENPLYRELVNKWFSYFDEKGFFDVLEEC